MTAFLFSSNTSYLPGPLPSDGWIARGSTPSWSIVQRRAEADEVAVGVHVRSFSKPVVGFNRLDETAHHRGGTPLDMQGVGVVDEEIHRAHVGTRIDVG